MNKKMQLNKHKKYFKAKKTKPKSQKKKQQQQQQQIKKKQGEGVAWLLTL